MGFIPITFNVTRSKAHQDVEVAFRKQAGSFEDLLTSDQKQKILERDDHTCQCCGFKSQKFQKILFKNENPDDQSLDNLATACIYCHQCFHFDTINDMKSGVLVWMPEIAQPVLNHVARSIYVARISQGPMSDTAKGLYDLIMGRRQSVIERLGTDDPMVVTSVMKDYLEDKHYNARMKKLSGIKLFPLDRRIVKEGELEFNQFPQILAYWRSKDGPYGGKMPNDWLAQYKDLALSDQKAA